MRTSTQRWPRIHKVGAAVSAALVVVMPIALVSAGKAPSSDAPLPVVGDPARPEATDASRVAIRPAPDAAPRDSTEVAIRFRDDFGLRSDRPYVLTVAADPSATSGEYGVPLLPAERALMDRKVELQAKLQEVDAYEARNQATFGGSWLDHRAPRQVDEPSRSSLLSCRTRLRTKKP